MFGSQHCCQAALAFPSLQLGEWILASFYCSQCRYPILLMPFVSSYCSLCWNPLIAQVLDIFVLLILLISFRIVYNYVGALSIFSYLLCMLLMWSHCLSRCYHLFGNDSIPGIIGSQYCCQAVLAFPVLYTIWWVYLGYTLIAHNIDILQYAIGVYLFLTLLESSHCTSLQYPCIDHVIDILWYRMQLGECIACIFLLLMLLI